MYKYEQQAPVLYLSISDFLGNLQTEIQIKELWIQYMCIYYS